uniref:AEC family transporter n=1 Tax=Candidatus Saccharicenans sp. TaxID=2819258 RepID=UPI00404AD4C6
MTIPVILVLVAAGFILKLVIRKDWVFNLIGILANDILLSFFVLSSIAGRSLDYLLGLKKVFFYVVAVVILCLVSSYIYGRYLVKEDRGWRGTLMVLAIFPNTAALGFPLVAIFTRDLTPAVLYSAASSLLAIPLATFLTIRYSQDSHALRETVTRTFSFPPVTVSLLSLIMVLGGLQLPAKLINLSQAIGWWCLPLMLVYFGSRLQFRNIPVRKILEAGFFRIILPFFLVWLTLRTPSQPVFYAVLIESSMPPAIMAASILAKHRLKAEESTVVTLVLTLAAILLIFLLKISGLGVSLAGL